MRILLFLLSLLSGASQASLDPAYDYVWAPMVWRSTGCPSGPTYSSGAEAIHTCTGSIAPNTWCRTATANMGWSYGEAMCNAQNVEIGTAGAQGLCDVGWEGITNDGIPGCRRLKNNSCRGLAGQAATASGDVDAGSAAVVWRFSCLPSGVSGKGCNVIWVGDGITGISKTLLGDGKRHYYQTGYWQYDSDGSGNATECTPDAAAKFTDFQPVKKTTDGKPSINGDGTNPPACKAGEQSGYVNNKPVCLKKSTDSNGGVNFGVTPETNPSYTLNKDGTVTTGNPAPGSYDEYCVKNPTSIICTSTGNGSGDGFTGDSGSGTGTSGTGTGTGTTDGTGTTTGTSQSCPGCALEVTLQGVKKLLDPTGVDAGAGLSGAGKAEDGLKAVGDGIQSTAAGNPQLSGLTWEFPSLFPVASECQPLVVAIGGRLSSGGSANINYCDALALVRSALGWVIYVITLIAVFNIATAKPPSTGGGKD